MGDRLGTPDAVGFFFTFNYFNLLSFILPYGENLCLADKKVCANFEIPRPISEIISNVGCGHTYMVTQLNYIVLSTGYAIMLLITDNVLKENLKDTTSLLVDKS